MYDIKDLGSLIPGGSVEPHAINYAGHVVGAATAQGGPRHAFYWTNQSGIKDLGCLQGDDHSAAGDINDSNVIVGYSRDNNSERSCVWVGAGGAPQVINLGTKFQEIWGNAIGINNAGHIIGRALPINTSSSSACIIINGLPHLLPNGIPTPWLGSSLKDVNDVGLALNNFGQAVGQVGYLLTQPLMWDPTTGRRKLEPPSIFSQQSGSAKAINDEGLAVGWAEVSVYGIGNTNQVMRAMLWNGPVSRVLLNIPGFDVSQALDINAGREIVGWAFNSSLVNGQRAMRWVKTFAEDLNTLIDPDLGWTLQRATSINNHGSIVGVGIHDGQSKGWLLTRRIRSIDWQALPAYVVQIVFGVVDDKPGVVINPRGEVIHPYPPPNPAWESLSAVARTELISIASASLLKSGRRRGAKIDQKTALDAVARRVKQLRGAPRAGLS